MGVARHVRTDDDCNNDSNDERYRFFRLGFGCGLLPLGHDGDGLGDRQKKSQRCTEKRVHVLRVVCKNANQVES